MANFNTGLTKTQIITALTNGLDAATESDLNALSARLELEIDEKADSTDLTAEAAAREDADAKHDAALVALIDSGSKNLLPMTHAAGSTTKNGVTCTWNPDDGTMTLTGSHAAGADSCIFEFYAGSAADQKVIPAGTYHLSGVPTGGSTSTFRAALTDISGAVDTGNGSDFTLSSPHYAAYRILISNACDFTGGMVFKPMICAKEAWDISDKFVPYVPSNAELYAMIQNL